MSRPKILVVGGGLAGLRAAITCADAGAAVTLVEARPRLGGATWSSRQGGIWIDNGQHVFLRCCTAYREFLQRIGAEDRVFLQPRLTIPVLAPGRATVRLRRNALPAPLHLATGLLSYAHLSWPERIRVIGAARKLARLDHQSDSVDRQSFGAWLAANGQSPAAIERFWDLFTRATLNITAPGASLSLAAMVFQTGLLTERDAGDIGWARVPLQHLHADPAREALEALGGEVELRGRVRGIETTSDGRARVWIGDRRIEPDALILAVPHSAAADLLPSEAGIDTERLRGLGASPIVNLHVIYDRRVMDSTFVAAVESPVQWIFDRTEASGLERGQCLAVSLSAADDYVGLSREALLERFAGEIERLLPRAVRDRITDFFVTCERAATFRQAPGTRRLRPGAKTDVQGLVLAGAWTDTGWPETMEGAVRSGLAAAREALIAVGRRRRLPETRAA